MSYTVLYGQPQGAPVNFLDKIREALIAEIIAINGYVDHIENSDMKEINKVWGNILQDEKDHYGMFLSLIHRYDPTQYQLYLKHVDDTIPVTPMQIYKPDNNRQLILNNVREDIKGELEAVILYQQLWNEMPYEDIRNVLRYVIDAEKEHAEHLTRVLLKYDTGRYNELK